MAKKNTLSIGGATYDLFVRLPQEALTKHEKDFTLPLGAKIRVEQMIESCGGGASNTAVGLARLGCAASFEGVLSADQWGEKLLSNLKNEGVDTTCVTVVEDEVSSFSLILSGPSGERVSLYEPGTNKHLHDVTFDRNVVSEMDWVYLNHIQEDSCVIQDDIVEGLAKSSIGLTWNPGGCQIDMGLSLPTNRELLRNTNLLLLNKEEALAFTKTQSVEDALKALIDAGVANTMITDGKHGTTATDGTNLLHCPVVPETKIIDTTGAGDAFGTGATWALVEGMTLPEALKAGSINAASVVGAIGSQTGLLKDTQIRKRLEESELVVSINPLFINTMSDDKLLHIQELIDSASASLKTANALLRDLTGVADTGRERNMARASVSSAAGAAIGSEGKIVEGIFDGQNMMDSNGQSYPVPANYASKSKLVEGDGMKLTITDEGKFIYKQIAPTPRKTVVGVLIQEDGQYKVLADGKAYRVLLASVTFYRAEVGDQVSILLPQEGEAIWGAIEAVIPKHIAESAAHATIRKASVDDIDGELSPSVE